MDNNRHTGLWKISKSPTFISWSDKKKMMDCFPVVREKNRFSCPASMTS